jgi:hypothetical protein
MLLSVRREVGGKEEREAGGGRSRCDGHAYLCPDANLYPDTLRTASLGKPRRTRAVDVPPTRRNVQHLSLCLGSECF